MTAQDGSRSQQPAPERECIRQALLDLCFERGYKQITLPILLERAKVDEQAFHRHFADPEDCFCAVYLEVRDEFLARVQRAVEDQPTWRDRIRATAYIFLRFLREDERVTRLSVVEVRSAGERAQLLFAQAAEVLYGLLDEGREKRDDPEAISRATAESIGGGIFAQIYAAVSHDSPLQEDIVPKLMYAAVMPYVGSAAALEELRIPSPAD